MGSNGDVLLGKFAEFSIISGTHFNLQQMIPAVICFGVVIVAVTWLTVAHQKNPAYDHLILVSSAGVCYHVTGY